MVYYEISGGPIEKTSVETVTVISLPWPYHARNLAQGRVGILQPPHNANREDDVEHIVRKVQIVYVADARCDALL